MNFLIDVWWGCTWGVGRADEIWDARNTTYVLGRIVISSSGVGA